MTWTPTVAISSPLNVLYGISPSLTVDVDTSQNGYGLCAHNVVDRTFFTITAGSLLHHHLRSLPRTTGYRLGRASAEDPKGIVAHGLRTYHLGPPQPVSQLVGTASFSQSCPATPI